MIHSDDINHSPIYTKIYLHIQKMTKSSLKVLTIHLEEIRPRDHEHL
jgi:hypothetical protein